MEEHSEKIYDDIVTGYYFWTRLDGGSLKYHFAWYIRTEHICWGDFARIGPTKHTNDAEQPDFIGWTKNDRVEPHIGEDRYN